MDHFDIVCLLFVGFYALQNHSGIVRTRTFSEMTIMWTLSFLSKEREKRKILIIRLIIFPNN